MVYGAQSLHKILQKELQFIIDLSIGMFMREIIIYLELQSWFIELFDLIWLYFNQFFVLRGCETDFIVIVNLLCQSTIIKIKGKYSENFLCIVNVSSVIKIICQATMRISNLLLINQKLWALSSNCKIVAYNPLMFVITIYKIIKNLHAFN